MRRRGCTMTFKYRIHQPALHHGARSHDTNHVAHRSTVGSHKMRSIHIHSSRNFLSLLNDHHLCTRNHLSLLRQRTSHRLGVRVTLSLGTSRCRIWERYRASVSRRMRVKAQAREQNLQESASRTEKVETDHRSLLHSTRSV